MKFKRHISMALALIMTLSLAACSSTGDTSSSSSSDSSSSSNTTSTDSAEMVVYWWGNQVRNDNTTATIELFEEEHEGVTVDGQFASWDDYWTKLATSSAGNALPDVIQMDYAYIAQYVDNGLLLDLTPYIESGALDLSDVDAGVVDSGMVNDGVYGISLGANCPSLFYNKTLLDEYGIEVPDNMTIEEFIAISNEVYEKTGYKTNFGTNLGFSDNHNILMYMLRAYDTEFVNTDNTFGVSSSDSFLEFFQLYETGMNEGWILDQKVFLELVASVEQNPLIYGSSVDKMSWCAFANSNELAAYTAAAPEGMELAIASYPSADTAKSNYFKPAMFFSVAATTENADLAVEFINSYVNSVEYNEILLAERGVPISSVVAEEISPLLSEEVLMSITYLNEVVAEASSPISPPSGDKLSECLEVLNDTCERLAYSQINAEEAAVELYDGIVAILG